jgi:hypothetical protein
MQESGCGKEVGNTSFRLEHFAAVSYRYMETPTEGKKKWKGLHVPSISGFSLLSLYATLVDFTP